METHTAPEDSGTDVVSSSRVKRPRYVVTINDGQAEVEHQVTITVQDRLRAEQIASQLGLPGIGDAQQTHVALWCWAALRRDQLTDAKAADFLNHQLVDFDQAEPKRDDVGPTQQADSPA